MSRFASDECNGRAGTWSLMSLEKYVGDPVERMAKNGNVVLDSPIYW